MTPHELLDAARDLMQRPDAPSTAAELTGYLDQAAQLVTQLQAASGASALQT